MDRINKILSEFGLSENEANVYREALRHEKITPFQLSKNIGLPRTTVYDVMTNLSLKGLIELRQSHGFEKRETWIKAKNPSVLREIIVRRRKELTRLEVDVMDILPELKKDTTATKGNVDFKLYPGVEGVKEVFLRINSLSGKTPVYVWDHLMPMDFLGRKTMNALVKSQLEYRKGNGAAVKTIIPLNDWTRHVLTYQYSRNREYIRLHNFRFIEQASFQLHQDIYIAGNILYLITAKEDESWALSIHSPLTVHTFRSLFEYMWQSATPLTEDFVRLLGSNEFFEYEKKKKGR